MSIISTYLPLAARVEGVAIDETGQKLVNVDNTFTLEDQLIFLYPTTVYAAYLLELNKWKKDLQALKERNTYSEDPQAAYRKKLVDDFLAKEPLTPPLPEKREGRSFDQYPSTSPNSVRMELGEFFFRLSLYPLVYFFNDLMEATGLADKIREFNSRCTAASWENPHFSTEDTKLIKLCGIIYFTLTKNGIGETESYEKRLHVFLSYAPPIIPYIRSGLVPEYARITVADFSDRIEGLATLTLKDYRRSIIDYEPYFIQSSHDSDRRIDYYWIRENKVKFFESLTDYYNRDIWTMLIDLPVEFDIGYYAAIDIYKVLITNGYIPSGAMLRGALDGLFGEAAARKDLILLLLKYNVPLDGGQSRYGPSNHSFSALSAAVMMNDTEILRKLLEKRVNINESNKYGFRPINRAISLVGEAINSDENERVKEEEVAAATRTFNMVASQNPDVNYFSKMNTTVLVDAIDLNLKVDHIRKLLELGANPNTEAAIFSADPRIKRGTIMTPLAFAKFKGMKDVVDLLIQYGATD